MSDGRGTYETKRLAENIQGQLDRLLTQLEDLELLKDEFTAEEYTEMKEETFIQLKEFSAFLEKSTAGHISLVDKFGAAQLAIQAAVSDAFKTPDIIRMFAEKQPDALRHRLQELIRDFKLKVLSESEFENQSLEILIALGKLAVTLSAEEQSLFEKLSTTSTFENAPDSILHSDTQNMLLASASNTN